MTKVTTCCCNSCPGCGTTLHDACSSCGVCHHGRHGTGPFWGRLLISLVFILGGLGKIIFFGAIAEALRGQGIATAAEWYLALGIIMELVGGLMVLFGWHTRIGCWILMVFLLPTTLIIHGFWNYQGAEIINQMAHFLKNLGLYGGLLLLVSYGPGRWSFDACRSCKCLKSCK